VGKVFFLPTLKWWAKKILPTPTNLLTLVQFLSGFYGFFDN